MTKFLSVSGRAAVNKALHPLGSALVRAGVSANAVTLVGTAAAVAGAVLLVTRGALLAGLIVVTVSVFTDLLDGAMARVKKSDGHFGALLDSTMDRVADGAIFASLAYWLAISGQHASAAACLICLVAAQLVSYVKSRAEALGARCDVGIAERAERLVIIGVGTLAQVCGVPYALAVTLWILAALTVFTVWQRVWYVRSQLNGDRR
ncbi:MAG TPA: CDP-alcohol phosphatidyltransferase family protein [Stackebrandtia sp.]|uniref:phosphatidylinositol phosphate synthase n=1 Tax=Stackebrandtia sp. TaxID=2023065 RepID=UPI002D2286EA|nr:CDP-alcohol phosphatidyltransferase family protein [Stackebrandtia sp.]HZE37840.1 CDP-alcohol phosphatidyltransferase family protein [Stackebrandtia sp.]